MAAKKTAKKIVKRGSRKTAEKPAASEKVVTYSSMRTLLTAKSRGVLPRGVRGKFDGEDVVLHDKKNNEIARVPTSAFVAGELKRHGFGFEA